VSDLVELFLARAAAAGCRTDGAPPGVPPVQAAFAVAETGSVVFVPSREQPRRSWLDTDVLVVAVPRDRIVPDLAALFRELGPEPPSAVAIVSGPSKTADIEQTLVVGVHGPREVHVLVAD
jgi:L-lactate dehydrogenase complex protein LldG